MPTTGRRDDPPKLPDMEKVNAAMDRRRKESELRDAIVEAAKKWRETDDAYASAYASDDALVMAVDNLLDFEEQQK
jgi:predicted nucleic-acid-binding protein